MKKYSFKEAVEKLSKMEKEAGFAIREDMLKPVEKGIEAGEYSFHISCTFGIGDAPLQRVWQNVRENYPIVPDDLEKEWYVILSEGYAFNGVLTMYTPPEKKFEIPGGSYSFKDVVVLMEKLKDAPCYTVREDVFYNWNSYISPSEHTFIFGENKRFPLICFAYEGKKNYEFTPEDLIQEWIIVESDDYKNCEEPQG